MALKPLPRPPLLPQRNQGIKAVGTGKTGTAATGTAKLVTVATLMRGQTYCYKNEFFYLDQPRTCTPEMANELEKLTEVHIVNGDEYDAYLFRVERNVPPPVDLVDQNERPQRNVLPPPKRSTYNPGRRPLR